MRFFRRLRVACVATSVAVMLGGCGDLTTTQGPVANSSDAPHLTKEQLVPAMAKAMTAAGAMHVKIRATRGGKESLIDADASMVPGGSIRVSVLDPIGLYGRPSTRKFELRLVGNSMYISAPGRPGKFFQADASDPRTLCGCIARKLRQEASPSEALDGIRRSLVGLEFVGLEARDGRYLQHYRAQFDPKRLDPKRARQLKPGAVFRYDMWLDADHLVRRMVGEEYGVEYDATYDNWGKRIDLDPPRPRQILNAAEAAKA